MRAPLGAHFGKRQQHYAMQLTAKRSTNQHARLKRLAFCKNTSSKLRFIGASTRIKLRSSHNKLVAHCPKFYFNIITYIILICQDKYMLKNAHRTRKNPTFHYMKQAKIYPKITPFALKTAC